MSAKQFQYFKQFHQPLAGLRQAKQAAKDTGQNMLTIAHHREMPAGFTAGQISRNCSLAGEQSR